MLTGLVTRHAITGALRPVTPDLLREALLLPQMAEGDLLAALEAMPDAPWAATYACAKSETAAILRVELGELVLAVPDMRPESLDLTGLPDSRAGRHMRALVALWQRLDAALPADLAAIRAAMAGQGVVLEPLPLLDLPLPADTPAAIVALRDALIARFGLAPAAASADWLKAKARLCAGADPATSLGHMQAHLRDAAPPLPQDDSLQIAGIRDLAEEADAAAATVQRLIRDGYRAEEVALLVPEDSTCHRHLARAFARAGVALSGLPVAADRRDLAGEALVHLLSALQTPAPVMAIASLYALPDLPWDAATGAALAREALGGHPQPHWVMDGPMRDLTGLIARPRPVDGEDLRKRLNQFAMLLPPSAMRDEINRRLPLLRAHLRAQTPPDWGLLTAIVAPRAPAAPEVARSVEGVAIIREGEDPWRPARVLLVLGVQDGRYPRAPGNSAMFLDSERAAIAAATGLRLSGRAEKLAQAMALFHRQIRLPSDRLILFCPRQDPGGASLMPGPALGLIARTIADPSGNGQPVTEPESLIRDLRARPDLPRSPADLAAPRAALPRDGLLRLDADLFMLRQTEDGTATPQSPSRLETLLVSPLAWALDQAGAGLVEWRPESWDIMTAGTLAHAVFEDLFQPGKPLPDDADITARTPAILTEAIRKRAPFAQGALWAVERDSLTRETILAAKNWARALRAMGADLVANEVGLRGHALGLKLRGFADSVLRLPDGSLLVVDHKKSKTGRRQERMEAGWDLQTELYRAMLRDPAPLPEGAPESPFAGLAGGTTIGVAYHLLNDSGILAHGIAITADEVTVLDTDISVNALAMLRDRIAEVGAGQLRLNNRDDADFFGKTGKFTPYALENSPLVSTFMVEGGAEDEA